ncbi:hypothetical protein CHS0354_014213 [Potamilus streckersoni]|uniref:Uncharacterized protein n=1 Tax=Potamilus streckersoni TaxID=2493646 RepID=A0AAE0T0A2_9BIVA|nr:hypothetical protein CHS0354_014213 [Potamilus streckersoni]
MGAKERLWIKFRSNFGLLVLFLFCLNFVLCASCPRECSCSKKKAVDCTNRGLFYVPVGIPLDTSRLDLQGNNITVIRRNDFRGLRQLRILHLLKNNIRSIERGSFQDLVAMERLRLDRNQMSHIPDLLFANMPNLERLDLSFNHLRSIGRKTLKGSVVLRNLQLDHNQISCIADTAISGLGEMLYLTLNNNNLTTLPNNLFADMQRLKVLRLRDNRFICDCHMVWLARWLKTRRKFAVHTTCSSPSHLRGFDIHSLGETDFKCNDVHSPPVRECLSQVACPHQCSCTEGIVDCRDRSLTEVPENIPDDATEIRLEQNHITKIPSKAFADLPRLRRIDLSNNQIANIAGDAFSGLSSLNTLVMYGNKLTELPPGIFRGLSSLQLLLLNANKISCVPLDTFEDLHNLNLLSLYDNKIESLANGTFIPLKNLQTLHLARNPFICDCNLQWLAKFLEIQPIETSGARCESPRRMNRKKISNTKDNKFKCKDAEIHRTKNAGRCIIDNVCPTQCECLGTTVDCSARRLTHIPLNLPSYTTELNLKDNQITKLSAEGLFELLPNLHILDLSDNLIEIVEEGTFRASAKLTELNLASNRLNKITGSQMNGLTGLHHLSLNGNRITCISNTTFTEMPNLRKLELFDNQISCIQESAFDRNKFISTINLMSNPFSCNCHLGWFSKWLQNKNVLVGSPTCYSPITLRDKPLMDVKPQDFVCAENNEIGCNLGIPACCTDTLTDPVIESNCDPRAYCPPLCTCTGTVVRCSRQDLTSVPQNIPSDTTELYLDANQIANLSTEIVHLTQLKRLDLSNNKLVSLQPYIFANLTELSTLILSYNSLQCVADTSFAGLRNLRILSLHGNDMSSIPYGAFKDLVALTHIALGGNPLYCDCELKWLSDWIKKDFVESGIAACVGPPAMANKLILTTPSYNFQCTGEGDPGILSKCNICYQNPCENSGKCHLVDFKEFRCECTPGFHGKRCEEEINACFGNPCMNDGKCAVMDHGRFQCTCLPGFKGDRCEINIDDCGQHQCENNATCVDGVQTYTCHCPLGFTGKKCEHKIHFCRGEYNYCENNAKCIAMDADYRCECPLGYSGKNCSANFDDCKSHICQHGATCVDGWNSYVCLCRRGFSGKFCEIAPIEQVYPSTGVCKNHDCQNNGVCYQPQGSSEYMCKCVSGFIGKKCEKLTSVSFLDHDSYIHLPKVTFQSTTNITIVLKTNHSGGLILYTGLEQHLAVELFKGRVAVSFYVGDEPISTLYSYVFSFVKVDDDNLHTLELLLHLKNFTMRVDGGYPHTVINQGNNQYLDVDDDLFLGGLPRAKSEMARSKFHIREGTSLKGCLHQVLINGKLLDFQVTKLNHKITPGCNVNPCQSHKCQNKGVCKPKDNMADYTCRCHRGFSGPFCDVAPTCTGRVFRDVYVDPKTNCRSRVRIKYRRCEGSCGNHCCQPKKIKNRKVRLYCSDNTSYIYDLPVIRRCGCKKC